MRSSKVEEASSITSDLSDVEGELDTHEFERRRWRYLSKQLFCEKKFVYLKNVLTKTRVSAIEKHQDDILNRRAEIFHRRKQTIDREFEEKKEQNEALYRLRCEALKRRINGDRRNAENNFVNQKIMLQEKIEDSIRERRTAIEDDLLEGKIALEFVDHLRQTASFVPDPMEEAGIKLAKQATKEKRPMMICQLSESDILHDLSLISRSMPAKRRRRNGKLFHDVQNGLP
ncbi:hypothetical protein AAVH_06219 [Aphelenchoides avenae]|nr:hypothetical protein AAVH_06219 [Aphelenchus avenae]